MDLHFSQEELDFQSSVKDWLKDNYPEDMRERYSNSPNGHLTREEHMRWQKSLYEKGWAGINWPKEYGGAEFTAAQKYLFNKFIQKKNCRYVFVTPHPPNDVVQRLNVEI